jgi:DNA-binding Xre family transcriptional regulator
MNRKVKSLMVLKGIKGTDIARQLGLSRVTVSVVITGKGKSRRIQQAIADTLGVSFDDLWSEKNKKRKGVNT